MVPGVTSALAVPAYAGIPVTHRDWASSVHIVTGHRQAGGAEEIPYEALVKAGGTLVFLMGVARLREIWRRPDGGGDAALCGGRADRTGERWRPRGSSGRTLPICPQRAATEGIRAPAVLVVGPVWLAPGEACLAGADAAVWMPRTHHPAEKTPERPLRSAADSGCGGAGISHHRDGTGGERRPRRGAEGAGALPVAGVHQPQRRGAVF